MDLIIGQKYSREFSPCGLDGVSIFKNFAPTTVSLQRYCNRLPVFEVVEIIKS